MIEEQDYYDIYMEDHSDDEELTEAEEAAQVDISNRCREWEQHHAY